ncbi:MAG TPA: AAA family ATPase [Candidatus Paceibacterota bacterium]
MYLKSLEISGFKSFAKKSSLEFAAPITSIVGPNGSGKSNVAEAFRFVLGEQSIKSMRGKRGEDLIFNGSQSAGRLNRASVKVVFDNEKRILPIDFDEVSLERVVHRDSSNEYLINGSSVRLKDISELLAAAHIGASGHHIISQGEADRILNANIRERREMVEDALGLKIYQYKKQESERKLTKTEENIKQVESLRREILPHLKFLKKQVEKVEKANEMREALKTLYKEYFKREETYLKHTRGTVEQEKHGPTQELKTLERELIEAKRILAESDGKDGKSAELINLEEQLKKSRFDKDLHTRDCGRIEGEIRSLERIIIREKKTVEEAEGKMVYLRDVETLALDMEKEIKTAEGTDNLSLVRGILERIRTMLGGFLSRNKATEMKTTIKESEEEIVKLQEEKRQIEKRIADLAVVEQGLTARYVDLRQTIEKEKDSNRDAEKNIFRIMAAEQSFRSELGALKAREEKLVFEEEAFKRELQEAMILAGREALNYPNFKVVDGAGMEASNELIVVESRHVQEERRHALEKIKIRLEDAGVTNSIDIMKEHTEVEERDAFLARELLDLESSAASLMTLIKDLDERLNVEFRNGIEKINIQFQAFFSLMFGGGSAALTVVREQKRKRKDTDLEGLIGDEIPEEIQSEEEGREGIEIEITLPRKKIKGLDMLSGGERALTSIALLFAVSQVNPPPFIILDETDAALDEANSRKYGDMIESLSKFSQLILITHNRETMSRAGVLYGITMGSDASSRLLSIAFDDAVKVAK